MEGIEGALFSSLLLMCLLTVLASPENENHILHSGRNERSTIFFPTGSSEVDGEQNDPGNIINDKGQGNTYLKLSNMPFEIDPFELTKIDTNYTNSDGQGVDNLLKTLNQSLGENILERSFGAGISKNNGEWPNRLGGRRKLDLSIIGAAVDALNPFTYMRGSFQGFRAVLRKNLRPFMRRFGSRRDVNIHTLTNTETTTVASPTAITNSPNELDNMKDSLSSNSDTLISTSSLNPDKSLDLKIPPELVNYAALEVNLKPNGDINIVPVTTRPLISEYVENKHNNGFQPNPYNGNSNGDDDNKHKNTNYNTGGANNNEDSVNNKLDNNNIANGNSNIQKNRDNYENFSNNFNNHMNNNNIAIEANTNGDKNEEHHILYPPKNNNNINHENDRITAINTKHIKENPNQIGNIAINKGNNHHIIHDTSHMSENNPQITPEIPEGHIKHINKVNTKFGYSGVERSKVVKLVTDKPLVVESVQDIINYQKEGKKQVISKKFRETNPIPIDVTNLYKPSSPKLTSHLDLSSPNISPTPDHIYLLPFRVDPSKDILKASSNVHSSRHFVQNRDSDNDVDASEIYYIDITIPDKQNSAPVVNHRRVSPLKKHYRSKRYKRSAANDTEWKKDKVIEILPRQMDYDGWQPIDTTDPMSNEPTLIYKPPSLERVHFGKEPPKEKPLYPVVPLNPPVYVIRAEPTKKEVHSIYGTENVDYLHVNPQTDSATAYSAFGGRKNQRRKKERNVSPKRERNSSSFSLSDIIQSFKQRETDSNSTTERRTTLTSTSTSKATITVTSTTPLTTTEFIPIVTTPKPSPLPIFTTKPKIVSTVPTTTSTENSSALLTTTQVLEEIDLFNEPEFSESTDLSINLLDNEDVNETNIFNKEENAPKMSESQFSEKLLALDDFYYASEDNKNSKDNNDETPNYDFFSLSESDPFASIIPSKNVDKKEKCDNVGNEEKQRYDTRDIYIAQASENTETRAAKRPSLFERLKNFDGAHFDPYIFSATENNEKSFIQKLPPPNFQFRELHSRNFKGPIGRHIELASKETNNRPWYLIDTRKPTPKFTNRRKKTEFPGRQNFISGRRSSKYPEDQFIYNPYFEEQFSLLKPSQSLTANSLSELLQIFKYVTTPRPVEKFLDSTSFLQKHRIFRYTKPTESPRNTKAFTTFRYTVPFSRAVTSTEASFTGIDSFALPLKVSNDSVVETNSLDGYLFSGSVSDPEYRRPDSHQNKIRQETLVKDKAFKDDKREKPHETKISKDFEREVIQALMINKKNKPKEIMMDKDAVQRGEIAPPFVIEIKENTKVPEEPSPYYIHEGHSKVEVFGLNTDEKVITTTTQAPISTTLGHILISPSMPVEEFVTVTTPALTPKVNESTVENSNNTSREVRYYDLEEFYHGVSLDDKVTVNKNVPLWTVQDHSVVKGQPSSNIHSSSFRNLFSTQYIDMQKKTKEPTRTSSTHISSPIEAFSKLFIDYFRNKSQAAPKSTDDATLVSQHDFAHLMAQGDDTKTAESETQTQIEAFLSNPLEYLEYLRMLDKTKTK